jgi:hypothetical protein
VRSAWCDEHLGCEQATDVVLDVDVVLGSLRKEAGGSLAKTTGLGPPTSPVRGTTDGHDITPRQPF